MPETNWREEAQGDAKSAVEDHFDEIVQDIIDDEGMRSLGRKNISDYDEDMDSAYSDKRYSLLEAAEVLDELSEYEETDGGVWEGLEPRAAVKIQAAYTYGNAVIGMATDILGRIAEEIESAEGNDLFFDRYEWMKSVGKVVRHPLAWHPDDALETGKDSEEEVEKAHAEYVKREVEKPVKTAIENW